MQAKLLQQEIVAPITDEIQQSVANARKEILETSNNALKLMELKLFSELYAICVPTKKRKETARAVREFRNNEWVEALKKANGNADKACNIIFSNS